MAASRTAKPLAELPPDLPAEVERAVRAAGALPTAKLTRVKLGPAARRELDRRLVATGLERTAKAVRVPLAEQLLALVQGGARVSLKDAAKRVKGGSKKELDAAIDALVRGGRAKVVVRTQVEVLVGGGDRALSAAEVGEIVEAHAALAKVLKKVTAKGRARSILREDLAALIGPIDARSPSACGRGARRDRGRSARAPRRARAGAHPGPGPRARRPGDDRRDPPRPPRRRRRRRGSSCAPRRAAST